MSLILGTGQSRRLRAAAVIAVLSLLSLLVAFVPVYDPWAWLVWGREVVALDLHTDAGPSWKPLPVMITALLVPAGGAAPELWLAIARAGWFAAAALAALLAARLVFPRRTATALAVRFAPRRVRAGRATAAVIAAAGIVLLHDEFTSWTRQFAGGLSEPLLVALVLGAIERHLALRPVQAFGLGVAAALLRPEAWPLLALYGVYLWRLDPRSRRLVVIGGAMVAILWIVPDLLGSGSPLTGAERARGATGSPPFEALEAIGRSLNLVLVGLLVAAAYAVFSARRDGERAIGVLAAGAVGWVAIVSVLAAIGFAGLPRFAAPAGAIACVLGGVGVVRIIAALDGMRGSDPRRRWALVGAGVLFATLGAQAAIRAAQIPGEVDESLSYGEQVNALSGVVFELGDERVAECGPIASTDFATQTALAWYVDLPIRAISIREKTAPADGTAFIYKTAPAELERVIASAGEQVAGRAGWTAIRVSCLERRNERP